LIVFRDKGNEMTDTVENLELEIIRLRAELAKAKEYANSVSQEAADLITRYCNERDKLRESLEPFAKLRVGRFMTNGIMYEWRIDVAHIRYANAVLEEMK
jgi:regulator of replication initiation timing